MSISNAAAAGWMGGCACTLQQPSPALEAAVVRAAVAMVTAGGRAVAAQKPSGSSVSPASAAPPGTTRSAFRARGRECRMVLTACEILAGFAGSPRMQRAAAGHGGAAAMAQALDIAAQVSGRTTSCPKSWRVVPNNGPCRCINVRELAGSCASALSSLDDLFSFNCHRPVPSLDHFRP